MLTTGIRQAPSSLFPLLFESVPPSLYVKLRSFVAYLTSEKEFTCVVPVTRSTLLETATIQGTTGSTAVFSLFPPPPISHCFVFPPPSPLFHPDNHSRRGDVPFDGSLPFSGLMDATELARWTRFANKGGIGKCTALQDCIAESEGDLMFLKVSYCYTAPI